MTCGQRCSNDCRSSCKGVGCAKGCQGCGGAWITGQDCHDECIHQCSGTCNGACENCSGTKNKPILVKIPHIYISYSIEVLIYKHADKLKYFRQFND